MIRCCWQSYCKWPESDLVLFMQRQACKRKCSWSYVAHPRQHPPFVILRKVNQLYKVGSFPELCCFSVQNMAGRDDCQFSLLKESPEKQLPPEVTFIRGSLRQGGWWAFSDPAASQPTVDCSDLKATDVRLVPTRFEVCENWGFWALFCVIEFTHRIISGNR